MPDRALRRIPEEVRKLIIQSENPQCPTGHYDLLGDPDGSPYGDSQKTPNARQGITTKELGTRICWPRLSRQKTPNARQGITTLSRESSTNSYW